MFFSAIALNHSTLLYTLIKIVRHERSGVPLDKADSCSPLLKSQWRELEFPKPQGGNRLLYAWHSFSEGQSGHFCTFKMQVFVSFKPTTEFVLNTSF